jgi:hypothetical protein
MRHPHTLPNDYVEAMSIRERFAMAAMQGIVSNAAAGAQCKMHYAVKMADDLIEELNRQPPREIA